jgi:hypothetical protein
MTLAAQAQEAFLETAALEIRVELLLDVAGQRAARFGGQAPRWRPGVEAGAAGS